MVTTVKISPKFQVVIPKHVRESMGLRPGTRVRVLQYGNRIEFVPIERLPALRGALKGIDTTVRREKDRP